MADTAKGASYSGVKLLQLLRGAMTDNPHEMLADNRLLKIGREVVQDNPKASALDVLTAYRDYGFTLAKAVGKSPEQIAQLMERQEFVQNTLNKLEQIYRDGEYIPDMMLTPAFVPIEEKLEPTPKPPMVAEAMPPVEPVEPKPAEKTEPKATKK